MCGGSPGWEARPIWLQGRGGVPVPMPLPEPLPCLSLLTTRDIPNSTQRVHGGPFPAAALSFQPESPGGWGAQPQERGNGCLGCPERGLGWLQPAPPSEGPSSRTYENYVSHRAQRHLLSHFENQRCSPTPPLEPERGFYCLEGVPGKWGGVGRKPSQVPPPPRPPLLTKLSPRVQIARSPPGTYGGNRLLAKWPQSQSKH